MDASRCPMVMDPPSLIFFRVPVSSCAAAGAAQIAHAIRLSNSFAVHLMYLLPGLSDSGADFSTDQRNFMHQCVNLATWLCLVQCRSDCQPQWPCLWWSACALVSPRMPNCCMCVYPRGGM